MFKRSVVFAVLGLLAGCNESSSYKDFDVAQTLAQQGEADGLQDFIADGFDVQQTTPGGVTLLHYAAGRGHVSTMEVLVRAGIDVNVRTTPAVGGDTPIGLAISNGHLEAVRWLLKNGADISEPVMRGKTALVVAEEAEYPEILNLITERLREVDQRQ